MSAPHAVPGSDDCAECGASYAGVHRPYGGHYPFCSLFNGTTAVEEQRADEQRWDDELTIPGEDDTA